VQQIALNFMYLVQLQGKCKTLNSHSHFGSLSSTLQVCIKKTFRRTQNLGKLVTLELIISVNSAVNFVF